MNWKTKRIVRTGMLCGLAYGLTAVGRVPIVLFLKYDPKDIVLAVSGLLFGPLTALTAAGLTAFAELLTLSETGLWGFLMNVLSSGAFACTAALVHRRRPTWAGAAAGLLCGWGAMVLTMLGWNYLIAPLYLGYPRQAVAELLLPVFLPFNLFKGGVNAAAALALYRPAAAALRSARLLEDK